MWMNSEINPPLWDEEGQGELSVTRPSRVWTSDWTPPLSVPRASCADASHWTPAPSLTSSANKLDCLPCLLLSTHFYFLIYLFFNVPSWPRVCEQGEKRCRFSRPIRFGWAAAFPLLLLLIFLSLSSALRYILAALEKKEVMGHVGSPPPPQPPRTHRLNAPLPV